MHHQSPGPALRLGTRASALARWQAEWVAQALRERAGVTVELVPIASEGDRDQQQPIGALGTQGVFTKALQQALGAGQIDLAVHSLKDLPTEPAPGLVLASVPEREVVFDVLVSREGTPLSQLAAGAVVGTGSLRRRAQLLHFRSDLSVADIRGNVGTRLRKLADGQYQALLLARAGLVRLGLAGEITEVLPPEIMLPAVGQGALGIEIRQDDERTRTAVVLLDDRESHAAVRAERQLLADLRGGCLAPVAAWARVEAQGQLRLSARVLTPDGSQMAQFHQVGSLDDPESLGRRGAEELFHQGAAEMIAAGRA